MIDKRVYYAVVAVCDDFGCQIIAEYPKDVDESCREMVLIELNGLTSIEERQINVDRNECTVNILVDELYFACLHRKADRPSSAGRLKSCATVFLQRLKTVYKELPIIADLSTKLANVISIDLSHHLKNIVDEYNDEDAVEECINQNDEVISHLKGDLTEIRGILMDSVRKLMDRGQKLDDLLEKTETLQNTSQNFHVMARTVPQRRNMLVATGAALFMCLSTSVFVVLLYAGIL